MKRMSLDERRRPEQDPLPIACNLGDIGLAARSEALRRELFAGAVERQELATGYAFRFPEGDEWSARLMDFIRTERQCCSFFRIELAFEPGDGPIWLRLTGAEGVKPFIEATFVVAEMV
jgi:hypothetical protein